MFHIVNHHQLDELVPFFDPVIRLVSGKLSHVFKCLILIEKVSSAWFASCHLVLPFSLSSSAQVFCLSGSRVPYLYFGPPFMRAFIISRTCLYTFRAVFARRFKYFHPFLLSSRLTIQGNRNRVALRDEIQRLPRWLPFIPFNKDILCRAFVLRVSNGQRAFMR